ncbi:MAG: hypothetical protein ACRBBP_00245 [Bdellovibrionales bacterium]
MHKLIKNLEFLLKVFLGMPAKVLLSMMMLFVVSCTPSEKEVTSEDLKGSNGFEGLTLAQTISSSKVRLTWPTYESSQLQGYAIYDVTLFSAPVLIKTAEPNETETIISNLDNASLKKFRVQAVTSGGKEDGNTNDLFAIPYAGVQSSTVVSSTSVRLDYPSPQDGEALEVRAYCQVGTDESWQLMATVSDMSLSSLVIEGLVPNIAYVCRVNVRVEGKEDNNLSRVNFVALGRADRIVFVTEPGNGQAGSLLTQQPIVHVLDENNNVVSGGPDSTALITLTIAASSPTGGTVGGVFQVNAVAGIADFTDLFMEESGGKILEAVKEDTSSLSFGTPVMTVESAPFNITAGAVSPDLTTIAINFAGGGTPVANGSDTYIVTFNLKDSFGNPVQGTRPEFASNIVGDFISQPLGSTDAAGQTTGSLTTTLSDTNTAIPRVLRISSPSGLDAIQVPAPFDPGAANKLAFSIQPENSPAGNLAMNEVRVAVQDINGNLITTGVDASAVINLSINNNIGGAVLSGVTSKAAVGGVAIFDDLGIDITENGYSLAASSGALNPGSSNNFNITSGVPKVIIMTGPAATLSGDCSAAITLQLQDFGGNPSKAIGTTTVQLSGLGNASLYSSSSCGGSAISTNVSFTPGTDTKVLYLESAKVEDLDIIGTDASAVLTPSAYNIQVSPSQLSIAVIGGAPLQVPSNACSTALEISPLAADGSPGEVFATTNVSLTGILGSQAEIFSDAACTTLIDHTSFPLIMAAVPSEKTRVYLRDPRGETLLVNVADPAGEISTISTPQTVIVGPSEMNLTGPSTVVSGVCSAVFTVSLRDSLGNNVASTGNTDLTINGLGSYPSGNFYTSPACGGGGSNTTVTVPDGSAQATVYFRGFASAVLDINLTDSAGDISASPTVQLSVTPSAFRITTVETSPSLTSECVGPFQVETLDGQNVVSPVVDPVTANLSGAGDAGAFYSDSECGVSITSLSYSNGESLKEFYFKGQYPEASLTLLATDAGAVLATGNLAWAVDADWGWIGTASLGFDLAGDPLPFRTGYSPVAAKYDGFRGVQSITFDPTNQYMYVTDFDSHKILKYDYVNHTYVGWIGRLLKENGIGATGSNVPTPSPALCVSTGNYQVLPGWCTGGRSVNGLETTGGLSGPWGITVDDTYVYTVNANTHSLSRYRADTGEFEGWIGMVHNTAPTGDATGSPGGCTSVPTSSQAMTPGWCIGGNRTSSSTTNGDGRLYAPRGITQDALNLYVVTERAVLKYNKATGAFVGWIGQVDSISPTGGAVGCTLTGDTQITPGWCVGGRYERGDARDTGAVNYGSDVYINGTDLYVLTRGNSGIINRYNKDTGAFIETLQNSKSSTWTNSYQVAFDGSRFYIADDERILKVDTTGLMEAWMGKVANNAGMSDAGGTGCNSLSPNENTPGWCLGGTHKPGLDETAFINTYAVAYDGVGSLVVASRDIPMIKKFNVATGAYQGSMGLESVSPDRWTADRTADAEYEGFDNNAYYAPMNSLVVGDYLFVSELYNSRVKKINKKTGEVYGIIGGMTTAPTGGEDPVCLTANAMSPSPDWCLGAYPYPNWTWNDNNMIDDLTDGIMNQPWGLASDGTWLYITDYARHRIQKFDIDTGVYGGWIGRVNATPTGGAPGCSTAVNNDFTPGWCFGGRSEPGSGDGNLDNPTGITYASGNLYVIDADNERVSSYNATTGAFNGWIGRINANPSSGCTPASNGAYNVSNTGWCIGGTARASSEETDRGGGFNFDYGDRADIYSDGVHLYITNTRNIRVDKYNFSGEFIEAAEARATEYTNTWQSAPADVAAVGSGSNCGYVQSMWGDSTYLYGLNTGPCSRDGATMRLWKMNKSTGTIIGWKGGVSAAVPPSGGDPGCVGATGSTPGWCTAGNVAVGQKLGQFAGEIGGVTGDDEFLYITDREANRVIRVPK